MYTLQGIKDAISQLHLRDYLLLEAWLRSRMPADPKYRVEEPVPAYSAQSVQRSMTVEEYLQFENESSHKHEYVAGQIFAMSGPSVRHGIIARNILTIAQHHLRGGPCQAFMADIQVQIATKDDCFFYYPDFFVVCGPLNQARHQVDNPRLVLEVLSPSTERIDRGEKFIYYRLIPALEEYVLVSQSTLEVTVHRRSEDWAPQVVTGLEEMVHFQSIGVQVPMRQIYEDVD